ncbi:uncharacterized protein LOC121730399 [Aricia agestis]|uniref:uncharacterized protein LOC121730399 n=1 Tax=Aricia agestis TaxID=91739 RepID=UPI001C204331|nr:uncharacterized protein LOC121730399 [Aricia agestis]
MGDLIEFTTRLKSEILFYKVNLGALLFSIKGDSNAVIGLAEKPHLPCIYWLYIGANGYSYIKKYQKSYKRVDTRDIIVRDEYKHFWLAWNDCKIRFGKRGDTKPILSKTIKENNLAYVTFTSFLPTDLYWRCIMPPYIEKPITAKLTGGEPQWIPATDQLPDNALIGGYENETLYIIRAPHRGSLASGKFVPSEGVGYIAWGGAAHEKNEFEVLSGFNCIWQKTRENIIPVGAVEAGYSEDFERGKLYVGRAEYEGHLIPGKVQPKYKLCYIPYNGREIERNEYEILVVPYTNERSTSDNYMVEVDMREFHENEFDESDSDNESIM